MEFSIHTSFTGTEMRIQSLCKALVLTGMFFSILVVAEPRHYVVDVKVIPPKAEGDYYVNLLTLLLNASKAPDEVIELRFSEKQLSQARWISEVYLGKGNDVLWTMTNLERESNLRPIRVPVLKGLLGYRLMVVRKENAEKFKEVKTLQDLQAFSFGQGFHWPDTDILKANNLRVVEALAKDNLYKMLAAKRFDFFPRGITEIDLEHEQIISQGLVVEPHLMLHYRTDMYFFVNKQNTELANRLEKGWSIILANGEFDKLYYNLPRVKAAITELKKHSRRIIELDNPFLPPATPMRADYWLDISTL